MIPQSQRVSDERIAELIAAQCEAFTYDADIGNCLRELLAARAEIARLTAALTDSAACFQHAFKYGGKCNTTIAAQSARIAALEAALREADEYLSSNDLNYIGAGSQLHRQFKATLGSRS